MPRKSKGFGSPEPTQTDTSEKRKSRQPETPPSFLGPVDTLAQIEARIIAIVGTTPQAVIMPVNADSLNHYQTILRDRLTLPIQLTGYEPLPWEEPYLYGRGIPADHQQQRSTQPSYLDQFQLVQIADAIDPDQGVMAILQRQPIPNQDIPELEATLPLANLKLAPREVGGQTQDLDDLNAQYLADYRYWFNHFRSP